MEVNISAKRSSKKDSKSVLDFCCGSYFMAMPNSHEFIFSNNTQKRLHIFFSFILGMCLAVGQLKNVPQSYFNCPLWEFQTQAQLNVIPILIVYVVLNFEFVYFKFELKMYGSIDHKWLFHPNINVCVCDGNWMFSLLIWNPKNVKKSLLGSVNERNW